MRVLFAIQCICTRLHDRAPSDFVKILLRWYVEEKSRPAKKMDFWAPKKPNFLPNDPNRVKTANLDSLLKSKHFGAVLTL